MPSSPPSYSPLPPDVESLAANLGRLNLTPPTTPQRRLYRINSPVRSGYTAHWDEAAHLTQGVAGARAFRVLDQSKKRPPAKAYAVFYGRLPGVYKTWAEARLQVDRVSGNLHQGYPSTDAADAAFDYAAARGWVGVCTARGLRPRLPAAPIPSLPQPLGVVDTPNPLHTGLTGAASAGSRWYVVYVGVCPGVYQSSLECGLNITGLPNAVHDSWDTMDAAVAQYQEAFDAGRVKIVCPPYSEL
ncbi:hypothetical protein C8R47DRAFT_1214865 [Mycena vitilis]|nr:hypothetical protein C8R47DRAFT_1230717 [Mycena vitilis]KAJ6490572.1 hypothetical protein C8R47DRAFT_1214865 [Mycena vitilis]